MSAYQFETAADETHANVLYDGVVVGTIQNNPEYLGGGLNFSRDSSKHGGAMPEVDFDLWDAFYDWIDSLAQAPAPQPHTCDSKTNNNEG